MRHLNTRISTAIVLFLIMLTPFFFSCKEENDWFALSVSDVNGQDYQENYEEFSQKIVIEGEVGSPLTDMHITFQAKNAQFQPYKQGADVSSWFKNVVEGLQYEIEEDVETPYDTAKVHIYGVPLDPSVEVNYDVNVEFSTFIFGTVKRVGTLTALGQYNIKDTNKVLLEVYKPVEVAGTVNTTLPESYDIVLRLRKNDTCYIKPITNETLTTKEDVEKLLKPYVQGLSYVVNTSKSENAKTPDTITITVSGKPADENEHLDDIEFTVPTDWIINNFSKGDVVVVDTNRVNYNINKEVPIQIDAVDVVNITGYKGYPVEEKELVVKIKDGTGKFIVTPRKEISIHHEYYEPQSRQSYPIIENSYNVLTDLTYEIEVKESDPTVLHLYISGSSSRNILKDKVEINIPSEFMVTNVGTYSPTRLVIKDKLTYKIMNKDPILKFENPQKFIGPTDFLSYGPSDTVSDTFIPWNERMGYSVDNPSFVNNYYNGKDSLETIITIENPRDNRFNIQAGWGNIVDTDKYFEITPLTDASGNKLNLTYQIVAYNYNTDRVDVFTGDLNISREKIFLGVKLFNQSGEEVRVTDGLVPIKVKVKAAAFEAPEYFEKESYEVSAGENEENRSYLGVFERKYDPYIADGAALVYYEDYYTEPPFTKDDNIIVLKPRLSDNASMTLKNGVPITYDTSDATRPGALVAHPVMDSEHPSHIPASSFPDVSTFTRRGFKAVGWSTVMGSGLVDYSQPLDKDGKPSGEKYKNTIENVAKYGLWLPESAGYVWPNPITSVVSLAWYFDLDHYWKKTDISKGGTVFPAVFRFAPKSEAASHSEVTIMSDELYTIYKENGEEDKETDRWGKVTKYGTYPDSHRNGSYYNTTDNKLPGSLGTNLDDYADKNEYNEVEIPAKGYTIPDVYATENGDALPVLRKMDHDFAMGEYFVTGYMHDVLYKWNIGSGTQENPEHGYIIPPLSQAFLAGPSYNSVTGFVNPSKLISYREEDRTTDSSVENANNVAYGGYSKGFNHNSYFDVMLHTRSYPLTWVSLTQAMVICNAFTEYYNEKTGSSLTPAYTKDHSLSWSSAIKSVDDALSVIGNAYQKKDFSGNESISWNYDTFANLTSTGFRLPTYDEWDFVAKLYVDRVDIVNEDSDMHKDEIARNKDRYDTIIKDITTNESNSYRHHPNAHFGFKANIHANRTTKEGVTSPSYTVAKGSSYPMFLTDNYSPQYYGPYRIENIADFYKYNMTTDNTQTTLEQEVRYYRATFTRDFISKVNYYGWYETEKILGDEYDPNAMASFYMYSRSLPAPSTNKEGFVNDKKPNAVGVYGLQGYIAELTDRFALSSDTPSLKRYTYLVNYLPPGKYYEESYRQQYYGFKKQLVHPNVHYANQGMRLVRTINITD